MVYLTAYNRLNKERSMKLATVALCACVLAGVAHGEQYSSDTTLSGDEPMVATTDAPVEFNVDAGVTVTVTRQITGDGKVVKSGSGMLVLAAANTFSGGLEFQAGEIRLDAEDSLGSGTVTYIGSSGHCLEFHAEGAIFTNDITFAAAGAKLSNERTHLLFTADTTLNGTITGPSSGSVYISPELITDNRPLTHQKVTFNGDLNFPNGTLYMHSYGTMTFNGKVNANSLSMNRASSACGYIYFNNPDNNLGNGTAVLCCRPYIHCGAKDVLKNFVWETRYFYGSSEANRIEMHGFDQTMKYMYINPPADPSYKPPSAPGDVSTCVCIGSTSPATLTLIGDTAANKQTITSHHAFVGAASVVLNATSSTFTLIMTNRTHTMNGLLAVSNGTMRATGAASFKNVPRIVVAQNGKLSLETSCANALAKLHKLDVEGKFTLASESAQSFDHPDVTIGADAEVTLPAGLAMTVRSLSVSGNPVADGTVLNAGDIPQLKSGTIKVMKELWPEATEPLYVIETTNGETNRLEDMTISVTENGATTTVPFADIANPTTGTIRKIGDGVVISSTRLSGFTGQILIEEGGFAIDDNLETGPTNGTTAVVWVKNGASFILSGTSGTCGYGKLRITNDFHIAGDGYNGLGAIDNELNVSQNNAFPSGTWHFEADARVSGFASDTRLDLSSLTFKMNEHRFCIKRASSSKATFPFYWTNVTAKRPGDIIVDGGKFYPQGTDYWVSEGATTITVTNGALFGYYNSYIRDAELVTLKFAAGAANEWVTAGSVGASSTVLPGAIKENWWEGPVQVDGTVKMYGSTDQKGLDLRGKVSGDGEIRFASGWLHLQNPENDFTAALSIEPYLSSSSYSKYQRGLAVYANGALPLCCRSVAVTNSPFAALDAARFDLPAIRMHVPASTNQSMYCNAAVKGGTLAGLLKTGAGTLDYEVPFAVTGAVEVAEGTLAAAGGLEAAVLATGGGTIDGDVAVTDAFRLVPSSVANGAISELNVTGSVAFGDGAKLDLDALADCGRIASPFLPHVVLRASGGITGTLGVEAGSETARRGWRCVIDGTTLSVFRCKGTMFCVR